MLKKYDFNTEKIPPLFSFHIFVTNLWAPGWDIIIVLITELKR